MVNALNMKIGFGLIGAGGIGFVHAWSAKVAPLSFEDLDPSNITLVGVYNRTLSKAERLAKRFGFKYATSDLDRVIKDSEINAFCVALANAFHKDPVLKISDEGKHVLCEKPLGLNYKEAEEMYKAVKSAGIVHAVALVMRFMPSVIYAKQLIKKGFLGKIYHFRAVVAHSRYVNPDLPIEWRMKKSIAGGGALADIGIHLMDLARFLVGELREVSAVTRTFIERRKTLDGKIDYVDVEDAGLMIFSFENGALGYIEATRFGPGFQELDRIEIHGSKGMIRFYLENPFEIFVYSLEDEAPGVKRIILKPWPKALWPPSKSISGWAFLFVKLMHEFFRAIIEGREASPNFYDGLKAQEILEAAYISAKEREWIRLPL